MPTDKTLWVRMGDGADYEDLGLQGEDALDSFVNLCFDLHIVGPLVFHDKWGISCEGFEAENHISLYWGDKNANPNICLTAIELKYINSELKKKVG